MSYTYKLARRLAQVHLVALALAFIACSDVAEPEAMPSEKSLESAPMVGASAAVVGVNASYANQPIGYGLITDRAFDAIQEVGWQLNTTPNLTIMNDNAAPQSPSHIGHLLFPVGHKGGTAPLMAWYDINGNRTKIYVSFWVKLSSNWVGHSSGVNKILFFTINKGNKVYLTAQGVGSNPLQPQVRVQQINEDPVTRNLLPNISPGKRIVRGQWSHWELILKANTNGQPNGTADWWVDGVKVGSYSNINYVSASASNVWEKIKWNPTWGGVGGVVPVDMYMDMDHTYVSGL